ncbi:MAG: class I SAM-dependent methyltransferase [Vicingaceae bacterium]
MVDSREHWDNRYSSAPYSDLGWYEEVPEPSLSLILQLLKSKEEVLLLCGAGATTLVDHLLEHRVKNVIAMDISRKALDLMKVRLGERAANVRFKAMDVLSAMDFKEVPEVDVWHDRAVLHFFTEEWQMERYVENLNAVLKVGGYFVAGVFSQKCKAMMCSGLQIKRYDVGAMKKLLGSKYELLYNKEELYYMPSGDERQYLYTVFRKVF